MRIISYRALGILASSFIAIHSGTCRAQDIGRTHQPLTAPATNEPSNPTTNATILTNFGCTGTLIAPDIVITATHSGCSSGALPLGGDSSIWSDQHAVWRAFRFPPMTVNRCCVTARRGQPAQVDRDQPGFDIASTPLPAAEPNLCRDMCSRNGDCGAWTYVRPGIQGARAMCYLKRVGLTVKFGNNRSSTIATRFASTYSMAGYEDIMMIHLDRPVQAIVARPARVLTELSHWENGNTWLGEHGFALAGWGGTHPVRQVAPASFAERPLRSNPNMMRLTGNGGATLEPGDSGGPSYMIAATGLPGGAFVRYLAGVSQGVEASGGRYITTFGHGGVDGDGHRKPDLGRWIDGALYADSFPRTSATIPLFDWWSESRKDNFLSSDPRWASTPRGLILSGQSIVNQRTKDGYRMFRLEGMVFNPRQPRPAGTVPLYSWWNPARHDNFTSTDPRWSIAPSQISWNGEHIEHGPTRDGYTLYRLEGYIYDPHRAQPPGTVPLYSWWNPNRTDNFTTSDTRWSVDPNELHWNGEHLTGGRHQEGYTLYRLEGYILDGSRAIQ